MGAELTIVGGGLGGLSAAVAAVEAGWTVRLFEAKAELGGRGRTTDDPYRANWGPHVVYSDGPLWRWLDERGLTHGVLSAPRTPRIMVRLEGRGRRVVPAGLVRALLTIRRAAAPVDLSFGEWAEAMVGDEHAARIGAFMGVVTFDHDPGRLSAAFVYVLSDLDAAGFCETFTRPDPSLAPAGMHLVQARAGMRPGETLDAAVLRLEALVDVGYDGWRDRETWRRQARIHDETGALDLPGRTWRDRPAVSRGDDVWLVNDCVAAPGLLSEVSHQAALQAVAELGAVSRRNVPRRLVHPA